MNELSKRLYDNYIAEIKEYLEFLKTKGYILLNEYGTTNLRLNQYNAKTGKFTPKYQLFELPVIIQENVKNYYNLDVSNDILNLVREIIPQLEHEDLSNYLSYINYSENVIDEKELKKEFKEIKKISKNIDSDIDKSVYELPFNQAIILNRKGIVYYPVRDMSRGYYIYEKSNDKFKKLNDNDIVKILEDEFKVKKFSRYEVLKLMKESYMNYLVQTELPIKWNESVKANTIMKVNKDGYNRVKKVTDNFI